MAELPPCYPSSPLIYMKVERYNKSKTQPNTRRKIERNKSNDYNRPLPPPCPWARLCASSIPSYIWAGNFPPSVAARNSITAWLHSSVEHSSEICRCLHLPAIQAVAFATAFNSEFCWSIYRLQWRKRCSCVSAADLPPLLHHQPLSSWRWPNRLR